MKNINNPELSHFFSDTFLFKDVSENDLTKIISYIEPEIKHFSAGEAIYSPTSFESKIGFVYEGECQIEKIKDSKSNLPLNKIGKYESFGVLAAFSCADSYPSQIIAKKNSTIVFITKNDILKLIEKSSKISLNLILFMSEKIAFLNKKISTFSSDTVEQKFSCYLLNEFKKSNCPELSINISKIATAINVGRASLYRAIDSLTVSNVIEFKNKKIFILDLEGLERISK